MIGFQDVKLLSAVAGRWLHSELRRQSLQAPESTSSGDYGSGTANAHTVALYASSSLVYLLVALGWIRAGYRVMLIS